MPFPVLLSTPPCRSLRHAASSSDPLLSNSWAPCKGAGVHSIGWHWALTRQTFKNSSSPVSIPSKWTRRAWVAKLLLTLSGDPRRTPEKQDVGTVTASQKMLTLQALLSSLNAGVQRGASWAEERLLGALRQSVPQNGRVHLFTHHRLLDRCDQTCLQWARSNLVGPAEWPKISLLNRGFGRIGFWEDFVRLS